MRKNKSKLSGIGLQFFAMPNLDTLDEQNAAILQKMQEAIKGDDAEAFGSAFGDFAQQMQSSILKDAKDLMGVNDVAVLAQRGVRQLTSNENDYFQAFIGAAKSTNPQQAVTDIMKTFPETEIDTIFDYLTENHPLLGAINFQNTGALVKIMMSTSSGVATWDELCSTIDDELGGAFSVLDLTLMKLSAYIPVCNAMLDLGPAWVERWVRTILAEAIAVGLEATIVDGDGSKKPLGMTRALTGDTGGAFPRKTPVAVTTLDPVTIGGLLNTISQGPNSKRRTVPELLMVVNPADYYTKVFPATTVRRTDGGYTMDAFPYPTRVIVSGAVPANYAVFGLASEYFMALGSGIGGKLEYTDHLKFLEDQRVYRIKLYGNGRPKDANAFVYADITNLKPTTLQVEVTNIDEFPVA